MEGITDTLQSTYDNLVGGGSGKSIFNTGDILNTDNPDNYYLYATFFITVIIFIGVALWVYNNYILPEIISPEYKANKEWDSSDNNDEGGKKADIYLFYTNWCPHCKDIMKEGDLIKNIDQGSWVKFKNKYNDVIVNGHSIIFHEIDCEVDESLANKFDIQGYPTIKLKKGDEIIEYDAKPSLETFEKFVNTVI